MLPRVSARRVWRVSLGCAYRARVSCRSITFPISFTTAGSPETLTWPWSYASTQSRIVAFGSPASVLKKTRGTDTSTRASPPGSRETFLSGSSTRHTAASPRAGSSSRITSLSWRSAGTSRQTWSIALPIKSLVSAVDIGTDSISPAATVAPPPPVRSKCPRDDPHHRQPGRRGDERRGHRPDRGCALGRVRTRTRGCVGLSPRRLGADPAARIRLHAGLQGARGARRPARRDPAAYAHTRSAHGQPAAVAAGGPAAVRPAGRLT